MVDAPVYDRKTFLPNRFICRTDFCRCANKNNCAYNFSLVRNFAELKKKEYFVLCKERPTRTF